MLDQKEDLQSADQVVVIIHCPCEGMVHCQHDIHAQQYHVWRDGAQNQALHQGYKGIVTKTIHKNSDCMKSTFD